MLVPELTRRKRDGGELSEEEIAFVVSGITGGSVSDAQVGALAMAIVWRGTTPAERIALTAEITRSGDVLNWSDGHTGRTPDKLEATPGYDTAPDNEAFRRAVREAGCGIVGQTGRLAPQ